MRLDLLSLLVISPKIVTQHRLRGLYLYLPDLEKGNLFNNSTTLVEVRAGLFSGNAAGRETESGKLLCVCKQAAFYCEGCYILRLSSGQRKHTEMEKLQTQKARNKQSRHISADENNEPQFAKPCKKKKKRHWGGNAK